MNYYSRFFEARPPFSIVKTLDTGPITNHVNFAHNENGTFAYVTVGGLNEVQVFRTDDFSKVATIPVGNLPHGIWPSGDGSRVYVGLENDDQLIAIDTMANKVIGTVPIGQAPQALAYVSNAVPPISAGNSAMTAMDKIEAFFPHPAAAMGLQQLGLAGEATHLNLAAGNGGNGATRPPTSVSLFDQGLTQVLEASVTGLQPAHPYVLALSDQSTGEGSLEPLAGFMTNPAGSAIVNAVGPIRQIVQSREPAQRRYLVIVEGMVGQKLGAPVQVQTDQASAK